MNIYLIHFFSGTDMVCIITSVFPIGLGFLFPIIITLLTTKPLKMEEIVDVWRETQFIDSQLTPWAELYSR